MQYRRVPKNGDELSALGFGAMRLPTKRGKIDDERATKQIRYAIDHGVNYIDTAVPYHQGGSEPFLGRALQDGYREKVKIATKLPPWKVTCREDMDTILDSQLQRLQTDHIDYYLLHGISAGDWKRLCGLGVLEFLESAKAAGKIVNSGFSYHGDRKTFREIIDAYPWVFCQIQYNFLDENTQAGTDGLHYAASKGIAVIIMEPLRGGRLANKLPKEVNRIYRDATPKRSAAAWALRWVWDHPEVTVVLSGMNDESQIAENIQTCDETSPDAMSPAEHEVIGKAAGVFRRQIKVGCTGCAYCMPCPAGVNIPECFRLYNDFYMEGTSSLMTRVFYGLQLLDGRGVPSHAALCKNCGKCVKACPQHIAVPDELKKVSKTLGGLRTKMLVPLVKLMFH